MSHPQRGHVQTPAAEPVLRDRCLSPAFQIIFQRSGRERSGMKELDFQSVREVAKMGYFAFIPLKRRF
jgi:hypothetical protein